MIKWHRDNVSEVEFLVFNNIKGKNIEPVFSEIDY